MFDYRTNLKRILQKTTGDDQSLKNSLAAIKLLLQMADGNAESVEKAPKNAKPVSVAEKNRQAKEVKKLLASLAQLINVPGKEDAKHNSLSALHKLIFMPGVNKQFGHELGLLDSAIQNSTTTKDAVNKQIFQEALKPKKQVKRDYRKGQRLTVIRLVSGAELINDNNEVVYTVKESQVHPLNLKTGDIVEALEEKDNPNYEAEILRVVGYKKMRQRDYDQVEEFKYGVVQGAKNQLAVSRNIKGKKLRIRGKEVVIPIDSSYYQGENIHVEDGSIVDLAWYAGDVRLKKKPADAVQVRWIYQTDPPKKSKPYAKKKKTNRQESESAMLDLDLHYARVGIAVGDNQNEGILEKIVAKYNGIAIPVDAFEGKKRLIENTIKDLDIVILVTAFAAHDSTWNIREFASKYHVKFAVSSSKGYRSFERALYRASKGLPAYEGTQSIEYKEKDK